MNRFYFSTLDFCIFVSTIFLWTSEGSGIICHCSYYCPDNHKNFTCESKYKCFASIAYEEDGATETEIRHGCMPAETEGGNFQCRAKNIKFERPKRVVCCNDRDLCNQYLNPTIPPGEIKQYIKNINKVSGPTNKISNQERHGLELVISITVCVMLLVIVLTYFYFRYRKIAIKRKHDHERKVFIHNGTEPVGSMGELLCSSSSGTGSGTPVFGKRRIADEILLLHEIGNGTFSTVYKGQWKQQYVAVKVFSSEDEDSWQREQDLYQTHYLCHENILNFIAADLQDVGHKRFDRLIVTSYESYGSLYDFLQKYSFDYRIMYRLAYSAICGLDYIHRTVVGSKGKPAIAHRNIKSKNILVKENLLCCVGDFGLAIKYDIESNKIDFGDNRKCATPRYMAPEILENSNLHSSTFTIYQMADVYSFGLVLWEITRRFEIDGKPEDYMQPYSDYVGEKPTIKQMYDLVCVKNVRPELPQRCINNEHGKSMYKLMEECWKYSSARPKTLRVKKTLQKLFQKDQKGSDTMVDSNRTGSTSVS